LVLPGKLSLLRTGAADEFSVLQLGAANCNGVEPRSGLL
jgi:hypothetical protein